MFEIFYKLILDFLKATWVLSAEMAPYLLLGFIIGGMLYAFLPSGLIAKYMGGESIASITRASLVGIPLPLCSCGVLPVAQTARQSGAGRGPTLSFLITTPVTGVDSILATYALMGWLFTLVRIMVSFVIGIFAGIVSRFVPGQSQALEPLYCDSCEMTKPAEGLWLKSQKAFLYAFSELPESLAGSVLVGLLIGGAIAVFISPEIVNKYIGTGFLGIIVSVLVAIPLYVCATGSIPIASAMIFSGFSPGAGLAFLIAGPATNAVAVTTVKKILGTKSLIIYLVMIFIGAVGFGKLFDWLLPDSAHLIKTIHIHGQEGLSWFHQICAIFLVGLLLTHKITSWVSSLKSRKEMTMEAENKIIFKVPDMSCEHCKKAISQELLKNHSIKSFAIDPNKKLVMVSGEQELNPETIIKDLEKIGYKATQIEKE